MTESTNDEIREQARRSIARLISIQRGDDTWNDDDYVTAGNVLIVCSRLIHQHTEQAVRKAYKDAFMIVTDADLTEVQATGILAERAGYGGIQLSDAQLTTNHNKEAK